MEIVISIVAGVIFTILIMVWFESRRKPSIVFRVETPPVTNPYSTNHPAQQARFLRVIVSNQKPVWGTIRSTAPCRARIRFLDKDKQQLQTDMMDGRWAGTPEPGNTPEINPNNNRIVMKPDLRTLFPYRTFEIPPGESEALDIVARFDKETECYGWSNKSYLHNWRDPTWKLDKDWYIAVVEIFTLGYKFEERFRVINTGNLNDFRLEHAKVEDYE